MTKTQNIIATVGFTVLCGVVFKSALLTSDKPAPVGVQPDATTLIAQNNSKPAQTSVQPVAAAAPVPVPPGVLPPIGESGSTSYTVAEADGKEVIPTDGKEILAPVGSYLPNRLDAVDPSNGSAPTEFLNKTNSNSKNQLLTPPNPQNVAGPVVSAETVPVPTGPVTEDR
jgi:hypothetical protein